MKITFETDENEAEEMTVFVQPDVPQLAQQNTDFLQQRSDLLKFLTFSEQPKRASP